MESVCDKLFEECGYDNVKECLAKLKSEAATLKRSSFANFTKDTLCDTLVLIAGSLFRSEVSSTNRSEENFLDACDSSSATPKKVNAKKNQQLPSGFTVNFPNINPNGYGFASMTFTTAPKKSRLPNQPREHLQTHELIFNKDDHEWKCGKIIIGSERERLLMVECLKNMEPRPEATVYGITDLPTHLDGSNKGRCFFFERWFYNNSRMNVRHWSDRTKFMFNSATLAHLLVNKPPPTATTEEMNAWSQKIEITALAMELTVSLDPPHQQGEYIACSSWFAMALLFFKLGHRVDGTVWSEMSIERGESLLHPDFKVSEDLLWEGRPNEEDFL
jgi:hypothetical protein